MLFCHAIYADEHWTRMNTLTTVFFLNLLQKNPFCKTQIIMTLSVQDKAKVNTKRYVELCYPD